MSATPCPLLPRRALAALAAGLLLAVAAPVAAQTHLDNPFVNATWYVNPDYTASVETAAAAATDSALAARMRIVGQQPTAIWLDTISQVGSVTTHLDRALAAGSNLVLLVLHDMPGRDCNALVSTGELPLTAAGLAAYETQYIDAIAAAAGQARYAGLRIVFIVEPGSLANLVTNLSTGACAGAQSSGLYVSAVQYAVNTLHALPNAYLYLDVAQAGWLGWAQNSTAMVSLLGVVANGFTAGKGAVNGFSTNVGSYVPVQEPWFTATTTIGGRQVMSASFYQYNPDLDDATYAADLSAKLLAAGWPDVGMIADTSRNGWGGPARPTGPSPDQSAVDPFVNASKVDRRAHRDLWCNPAGAGIGERPRAAPTDFPSAHYDAYVWARSPGQSDGASDNIYDGPWYNPMCDPTYYDAAIGVYTGALPHAPPAGQWFPAQFTELVQNAWPPLDAAYTLTIAKTGNGTGTVTSAPAGIACGTTCSAAFAPGTAAVTLTATPAAGSTFAGWSGPCTGTGACVVSMTQDRAVTADFESPGGFTLAVAKSGTGNGRVVSSPPGIDCGSTCQAMFPPGTQVTLTVVAASGSTFAGWTGCTATGTTCVATMTSARTVGVTFQSAPTYPLTVTRAGLGTGTVVSSPAGIQCGATCSATYASGTVVTLTGVPATGSVWLGWSGACSGTSSTCTVTLSQAQAVTATFAGPNPTLAVTVSGAGVVQSSPAGISCGGTCSARFLPGAAVTLTAIAASGAKFSGWTGACNGTATTCVVSMPANQNVSVAAAFTAAATAPCANAITFSNTTGNFNTTGPVCYRTSQKVSGWGCSNFNGRTVSVNGKAAACGAGPFPLAKFTDGYTYFSATAGAYPWASLYVW